MPRLNDHIEVFHSDDYNEGDLNLAPGWYYWWCLPGCLPDGDPNGPYETEELATQAAEDEYADDLADAAEE